ncbi:MAG: glycosyltransferase [Rhodospirillales bacterium]|nr:glycosyltransferase [Alphaproteobacteria bacterium]USO05418.1 MAG: glycosyltransferase [Rhodospirillales bacterium]
MRILQVMAGAEHGGAETAFVDMCLALHEAGEVVEVATRANDIRVPRLQKAGIPVHILPFGGAVDVYTGARLRKIIQKFRPDIVQSWMSRAPSKVPRWKASMGCPRYVHVARLGSPYKMKYFKTAEYFVAITPLIREHILAHGVVGDHVVHINNFAEVEPVTQAINRADFDTPEGAPLVLGLGRLHPDKAFDTLIEVAAAQPDLYVWIAGEGPQRAELESLIEKLGVGNRVKLLGWRTDRAALLRAADICAFISRDEGFGTVFVQAWAQGIPVVVCEADGPRQFVRHEEDGLMAPIDDVEAIGAYIRQLIEEPDLVERLVRGGHARYEAEFTKQASLQGYLQFYHDILEREGLLGR